MKPRVNEDMPCSEARATIQVCMDEPLATDRETALSKHLSECNLCASYQADLGAMRDALRSMPLFELPAEIRQDLRSAGGEGSAQ